MLLEEQDAASTRATREEMRQLLRTSRLSVDWEHAGGPEQRPAPRCHLALIPMILLLTPHCTAAQQQQLLTTVRLSIQRLGPSNSNSVLSHQSKSLKRPLLDEFLDILPSLNADAQPCAIEMMRAVGFNTTLAHMRKFFALLRRRGNSPYWPRNMLELLRALRGMVSQLHTDRDGMTSGPEHYFHLNGNKSGLCIMHYFPHSAKKNAKSRKQQDELAAHMGHGNWFFGSDNGRPQVFRDYQQHIFWDNDN